MYTTKTKNKMKKAKVLITIRGGNIEHIAATTDQIEFVIIDHDNFENDHAKALEEIGNLYKPDALMSLDEMNYHIEGVRDEYKPKSDIPECDV